MRVLDVGSGVGGPTRTLAAVLAGPVGGIHLPTFWASAPEHNVLTSPGEMRELLRAAGFIEIAWEDVTAEYAEQARRRGPSAGPLGRGVIVASDAAEKSANPLRKRAEGRIVHVRAVMRQGGKG